MALLRAEAEKLSNNDLVSGVVQEILDRDDMLALLPFTQVNGKAYVYNRENALPSADFLDPNDVVNESAGTFTEITARLRILAGDVDVDKFLSGTMDDSNSQIAIQLAMKAKALGRIFSQTVATGDVTVNAKSFDGLPRLTVAGQTLYAGANGGAVTMSMMDELKDAVNLGADAFVMRKGTWRALKQAMRAAGGNSAEMLQIDNFGYPIPSFDGIPVLLNDYLAVNEVRGTSGAATCSVYAVRMNEADGLHGLFGGPSAGFVVENIGTVQNKDAERVRLKWYAGLALKSTKSIARLAGITNV